MFVLKVSGPDSPLDYFTVFVPGLLGLCPGHLLCDLPDVRENLRGWAHSSLVSVSSAVV